MDYKNLSDILDSNTKKINDEINNFKETVDLINLNIKNKLKLLNDREKNIRVKEIEIQNRFDEIDQFKKVSVYKHLSDQLLEKDLEIEILKKKLNNSKSKVDNLSVSKSIKSNQINSIEESILSNEDEKSNNTTSEEINELSKNMSDEEDIEFFEETIDDRSYFFGSDNYIYEKQDNGEIGSLKLGTWSEDKTNGELIIVLD